MDGIGNRDIESYVRTLVSKGLGQQFKDKERSVGQTDETGTNVPIVERINPTTE